MKNLSFVFTALLMAVSCESDSLDISNFAQHNLKNNLTLTGKLLRVTQFPTSIDNIIDGSSCFGLQLPVAVIVNGQSLVMQDSSGYAQVNDIINESSTDVDSIQIQFPITVTLYDYSQRVFQSLAELEFAAQSCMPSEELSCIDLVFPIKVTAYEYESQEWEKYIFQNKAAFYQCMRQIDTYDVVSLVYPVTLTAPDGSATIIHDDHELESVIDYYIPECSN